MIDMHVLPCQPRTGPDQTVVNENAEDNQPRFGFLMAGIMWQRHPRFSFFILIAFIATVYLLYPSQEVAPPQTIYILRENNLANAVARAQRIYDKTLRNRQTLIKKFGPTPKDVTL